MLSHLISLLSPPTAGDEDERRLARLLTWVSLTAGIVTLLFLLPPLVEFPPSPSRLTGVGALLAAYLAASALGRARRGRLGGLLLTGAFWTASTLIILRYSEQVDLGLGCYVITVLTANLLLGETAALFFLFISASAGLAGLTVWQTGWLTQPELLPAGSPLPSQVGIFIATLLLVQFAFRSLRDALAKARHDEARLTRRAVQLRLVADLARDATSVLQVDQLLNQAVAMIRERFGFYYVGLYLLDETGENALLRAATGEAGRALLERGHSLKVGPNGLVARAVQQGQQQIALNVDREPFHIKNPLLPGTRSELTVPLQVNKIIFGALDVQSDRPDTFDAEDRLIMQMVADQVSVAFESARRLDATRRQVEELTVLHAVANAASESLNLETLLDHLTTVIGARLFPDNFGVLLLDERNGWLVRHSSYQERNEILQSPIWLGKGVTGLVALDGQPRRIGDVSQASEYLNVDPLTRSELCVPIQARGKVLGVINAESTVLDAFTEADERLLSTLAGQIAIAIEKLRLFEAERRRREEAEILRDAAAALTATLNLNQILDRILTYLQRFIPYYSACIFLHEGDSLHAVAGRGLPDSERLIGARFPSDDALFQEIARTRRPLIIADAQQDKRFQGWGESTYTRGWAAIPLLARGELLGYLTIDSLKPAAYEAGEIELAQAMANQAASAIENARMYAQEQQRAADLEELDRLKGQFIQNVSHELRTPLAIIRGYAELMYEGGLGDLLPAQSEAVAVIARRVRALNKLVDDLLAIQDTGMLKGLNETVDLGTLARSVAADFQDNLQQAGLSLDEDIAPALPAVSGNPNHLRRVIDNLLSNALKFSTPGGRIGLRVYANERSVFLEVVDTGIGIPADQLERIFDRFYQINGASTRRYGGSGLGLAVVKEIVTAHHGKVSVESQLEHGSRFIVELPAHPGAV